MLTNIADIIYLNIYFLDISALLSLSIFQFV